TSIVVLLVAALFAYQSESISDLFTFFLAFLGGVGPVYVMRWLWWRVRAQTEIVAMCTSAASTILITYVLGPIWDLGPLSDGGALRPEGRLVVVVLCSLAASLVHLAIARPPAAQRLVPFYERVRPIGFWGPVRRLASGSTEQALSWWPPLLGIVGGLALIFGLLFGVGRLILEGGGGAAAPFGIAVLGATVVGWSLRQARPIAEK
ncbi:MAG: hypothetical protein AAF581_10955, partial [Planctomycetota bacterium]